jgi:heme/copper-type cytochrome/quinol oxidase subunit 3
MKMRNCVSHTVFTKLFGMTFVAFPVTEYDEVFSGYQPGQMVER